MSPRFYLPLLFTLLSARRAARLALRLLYAQFGNVISYMSRPALPCRKSITIYALKFDAAESRPSYRHRI